MLNNDEIKDVIVGYDALNKIADIRLHLIAQKMEIKNNLHKCEGLCGQSGHVFTVENNHRCKFCGKIKSWDEK